MANSKRTKLFCLTSYKRWMALLAVLFVVLVVWIGFGFDDDKARANIQKFDKIGDDTLDLAHRTGVLDGAQMTKLQQSYSDIAAEARLFTVNISATSGSFIQPGAGMKFVDPFGETPGANPVIGVKALTAPPISPNAQMPHTYRGVCSNCHKLIPKVPARKVAGLTPGRTSVGSGIIVDPAGYILTNYHIIEKSTNILVTTADGAKYRGVIKYSDAASDLAIVKIDTTVALPAAAIGDSDLVQTGDIVLAVGSPFGLKQTVTSGIISDTSRVVMIGGVEQKNLIQTDAAINKGSSGGPLVDINGKVIGINTAIYSLTGDFTGVGFAIPINKAQEIFIAVPNLGSMAVNMIDLNAGDVITVAIQPNVPDAWFGVEVGSIDPIMAEQFGLKSTKGLLVNRVFKNSPAMSAGVERGDVMLEINGRRLLNMNRFQKITSLLAVGETINLKVRRNNRVIKFTTKLKARDNRIVRRAGTGQNIAGPAEMEWAGMEVVPITPQLATKWGVVKGEKGVIIIEAEGIAAAAGIMAGDVIKGVNRNRVTNMGSFAGVTGKMNILDGVLMDITRQGDPLFITM